MKKYLDFHLHTYYSDGEDSPTVLLDKAVAAKLQAIAITDHGTVQGIPEAIAYSTGKIDFLAGIELSCDEPALGIVDIHILGLGIDYKNKALLTWLTKAKAATVLHKESMVRKLNQLGFAISLADAAIFTKGEVGRPHIAKALMKKYPDRFDTVQQVFDEYLGEGKAAYVPAVHRTGIAPMIEVIHQAGGVAILAHPGYFDQKKFKKIISLFMKNKGDGLEAYYVYGKHPFSQSGTETNEYMRSFARKKGLLLSGGSDYHGSFKTVQVGEAKVPYSILNRLQQRAKQYKSYVHSVNSRKGIVSPLGSQRLCLSGDQ